MLALPKNERRNKGEEAYLSPPRKAHLRDPNVRRPLLRRVNLARPPRLDLLRNLLLLRNRLLPPDIIVALLLLLLLLLLSVVRRERFRELALRRGVERNDPGVEVFQEGIVDLVARGEVLATFFEVGEGVAEEQTF